MYRSPNRMHDRQSFYKYMSADVAKLVLTNYTLRWSSPTLFNDPFDVPRELSFGLTPQEIFKAVADRNISLIENPPENLSELEPKLRMIIEMVRRPISEELKADLIAGIREVVDTHNPSTESLEALRDMWRTLIPEFRILCLTESHERTSMWYHYADKYKGAVIEFHCNDELDSAWLAAQAVTYPTEKPGVYHAEGWANFLTMPIELAIKKLLHVATYTKSPDWSYENEWRITSFQRPKETGLFFDYKFNPKEIAAVYLGPLMKSEDKTKLLELTATMPHIRVFETEIGMSRSFSFKELKGSTSF